MSKQYQVWKAQPFTNSLTPQDVVAKVKNLIQDISQFYGLVGLNADEAEGIYAYIFTYLNKFPLFKLIDMDRAFELHRRQPELNKLTPAYFESVFNAYRKSPERAEIMKLHNEEIDSRIPEKTESITREQRFNDCFAHWKLTGEIRLNSGAVYVETFKSMKEALGMDELERIAKEEKDRTLQKLEALRATLTKMSEHHELESQIDDVQKGGALLKNAIRRAHLKAYFEMMEKSLV